MGKFYVSCSSLSLGKQSYILVLGSLAQYNDAIFISVDTVNNTLTQLGRCSHTQTTHISTCGIALKAALRVLIVPLWSHKWLPFLTQRILYLCLRCKMFANIGEDFAIVLILLTLWDNLFWKHQQDSHFSYPFRKVRLVPITNHLLMLKC